MHLSRSTAKSVSLRGLLLTLAWLLAGCASQAPAPVIDRTAPLTQPTDAQAATPTVLPATATTYTVKKGDTLISIGLEHGQSYRDLAAWNSIENPDKILVGQQLRVRPAEADTAAPVAVAKPVAIPAAVEARPLGGSSSTAGDTETFKREPRGGKLPYSEEALARLQRPPPAPAIELNSESKPALAEKPIEKPAPALAADDTLEWAWPAAGKLIVNFGEGNAKGIDISGKTGDPVQAAAAGKVILVSNALPGYGNFVIIKHNQTYLSVYAHNSRILVKEEQAVTKGQKIAEIGSSQTDQPKLHFEVRNKGKPVDPLKFLPVR